MQHALWEPANPSTSSSKSAASPMDMHYEVPSEVQMSNTAQDNGCHVHMCRHCLLDLKGIPIDMAHLIRSYVACLTL